MAETLSGHSLGEVISRFIGMLGKDPAFQGADQAVIEAEALKRAKETLENRVASGRESRVNNERQKNAKEWTRKSLSDNKSERAEAEREAKLDAYSPVADPVAHIENIQKTIESSAPAWLGSISIKYNPACAEAAADIVMHSYIQDSAVDLNRVAARVYWSTDWMSASKEVVRETRDFLSTLYQRVSELKDSRGMPQLDISPGDLWRAVDSRVDIYKTERIDITSGAKTQLGKQERNLDQALRQYQGYLDAQMGSGNDERYLEELRDVLARGKGKLFESTTTQVFIDKVSSRLDEMREHLGQQQNMKQREQMLTSGRVVEWKPEYDERFQNHHEPGEFSPEMQVAFSKDELEMIMSGYDGQKRWLSKFRKEVFDLGTQITQPNFTQLYKWESFFNLTKWTWGEKFANIPNEFKAKWESFIKFDQLKGLIYGPGKLEDKVQYLRLVTPADADRLLAYDDMQIVRPNYADVIKDFIKNDEVVYSAAGKWLQEENPIDVVTMLKVDAPTIYKDLIREKKPITRDKLLSKLSTLRLEELKYQIQQGKIDSETDIDERYIRKALHVSAPELEDSASYGNHERLQTEIQDVINKREKELTDRLKDLRFEIQQKRDIVGVGVMLRDYHMLPHTRVYDTELAPLQRDYVEQESILQSNTDKDAKTTARKKMNSLQEQFRRAWKRYALDDSDIPNITDTYELVAVQGLSPVEIEVRKRAKLQLKVLNNWSDDQIRAHEYVLQDAIWASRTHIIGNTEAMDISSKMGIAPLVGFESLADWKKIKADYMKTGYIMQGAFCEPVQRGLNEMMFADRYSMGGELGDEFRDYIYTRAFQKGGYDIEKQGSPEWKQRLAEAKQKGEPIWRVHAQYAEEELGISFSEIQRPEVQATGLQNVSTAWRNQMAIVEPIQKALLERKRLPVGAKGYLRPDAIIDNQGLAIQFNAAKSVQEKRAFGIRLLQRKPSVAFQELGKDFNVELAGIGLDPEKPEWRQFQRALSSAELKLVLDDELSVRKFDFLNRSDFDSIMPDIIRKMGVTKKAEVVKKADIYFNAIGKMWKKMNAPVSEGKKTRLDRWAEHGFSHISSLTLSDLNIRQTDPILLGAYTSERRVNDFLEQVKVQEGKRKFYRPEFLTPLEPTESWKLIREMGETAQGYAGIDVQEAVEDMMIDGVMHINSLRAVGAKWIPGAVTLMKKLSEQQPSEMWPFSLIPGWKQAMKTYKIDGKTIDQWPRSIGGAVSAAVKFTGHEGNAWDETKRAGEFAKIRLMGMFINHPEKINALERKYKSTLSFRSLAAIRKYWWIIPLATIAVALTSEIEDEKKRSH